MRTETALETVDGQNWSCTAGGWPWSRQQQSRLVFHMNSIRKKQEHKPKLIK